jgi:hypothetical protein
VGTHPLNLVLRFFLELVALFALGLWGWQLSDGWVSLLFAAGIPIFTALLWAVFAVPNDPSRSGKAPVPIPGVLRLVLELAFFGFAVWAFYDSGYQWVSLAFGLLVAIHYLISYDRIIWLLKK